MDTVFEPGCKTSLVIVVYSRKRKPTLTTASRPVFSWTTIGPCEKMASTPTALPCSPSPPVATALIVPCAHKPTKHWEKREGAYHGSIAGDGSGDKDVPGGIIRHPWKVEYEPVFWRISRFTYNTDGQLSPTDSARQWWPQQERGGGIAGRASCRKERED